MFTIDYEGGAKRVQFLLYYFSLCWARFMYLDIVSFIRAKKFTPPVILFWVSSLCGFSKVGEIYLTSFFHQGNCYLPSQIEGSCIQILPWFWNHSLVLCLEHITHELLRSMKRLQSNWTKRFMLKFGDWWIIFFFFKQCWVACFFSSSSKFTYCILLTKFMTNFQ